MVQFSIHTHTFVRLHVSTYMRARRLKYAAAGGQLISSVLCHKGSLLLPAFLQQGVTGNSSVNAQEHVAHAHSTTCTKLLQCKYNNQIQPCFSSWGFDAAFSWGYATVHLLFLLVAVPPDFWRILAKILWKIVFTLTDWSVSILFMIFFMHTPMPFNKRVFLICHFSNKTIQ